jgi:hypothetical protein
MLGLPLAGVSRSWFEAPIRIAVLLLDVYYGKYAIALPDYKIGAVRFDIWIQEVEIGQRDAPPRRGVCACVAGPNRVVPAAFYFGSICQARWHRVCAHGRTDVDLHFSPSDQCPEWNQARVLCKQLRDGNLSGLLFGDALHRVICLDSVHVARCWQTDLRAC